MIVLKSVKYVLYNINSMLDDKTAVLRNVKYSDGAVDGVSCKPLQLIFTNEKDR